MRVGIMKILKVVIMIWILLSSNLALCGRFASDYPCTDIGKTCVSSGERIIDGEKVYRDCWEWKYTKTCNYPSKNDCGGSTILLTSTILSWGTNPPETKYTLLLISSLMPRKKGTRSISPSLG